MSGGSYIGGSTVIRVFYRPSKVKNDELILAKIGILNTRFASGSLSKSEYKSLCNQILQSLPIGIKTRYLNAMTFLPLEREERRFSPKISKRKKRGMRPDKKYERYLAAKNKLK